MRSKMLFTSSSTRTSTMASVKSAFSGTRSPRANMRATTAAAAFSTLAVNTGGAYFGAQDGTPFPDPEGYFAPLRRLYALQYQSPARAGGPHALSVQVQGQSGAVQSNEQSFSIDLEPPNPILVPTLRELLLAHLPLLRRRPPHPALRKMAAGFAPACREHEEVRRTTPAVLRPPTRRRRCLLHRRFFFASAVWRPKKASIALWSCSSALPDFTTDCACSSPAKAPPAPANDAAPGDGARRSFAERKVEWERQLLQVELARHAGNREATARSLGITVRNLYYKLRRLGVA